MINFKKTLSISQMKNIKGGSGGCGYRTSSGSISCNVSREAAQAAVSGGGNWCCDSCSTSSYCRPQWTPLTNGGGTGSDPKGPLY